MRPLKPFLLACSRSLTTRVRRLEVTRARSSDYHKSANPVAPSRQCAAFGKANGHVDGGATREGERADVIGDESRVRGVETTTPWDRSGE